jgi:hypothetical protein
MQENSVLLVYGENLGDLIQKFSSWLEEKSDRFLVLVGEEEELLPLSFLSHPQVRLLSLHADEERIEQLTWEFSFLSFEYKIFGKPKKIERAEKLFSQIENGRTSVHLIASDFRDLGKRVLSNYLTNFPKLRHAKKGRELFSAFKGVPALILAAGPSLEKEIEEIRAWQNRALLFAGGTSLNALSFFSLIPDFTCALDPEPPIRRFLDQTAYEVPFFYQNRVSQELLGLVHGPKLWIPDNGNYPIEEWVQEQINLESSTFDAGWNVSTFCTALATALGCSPIIFVGLELSTASEEVYAKGVLEKIGKEFVEAFDVHGKKVKTKQDWLMAASWLEQFAKEHPETEFFNATKGGLALSSIPRKSLRELRNQFGQKMFDAKGVVHTAIQQITGCDEKSLSSPASEAIQTSFSNCFDLSQKLLALFEKSYPQVTLNGQAALWEVEMEEEIAYRHFIEPLWRIWGPLFQRSAPDLSMNLHKLLFIQKIGSS